MRLTLTDRQRDILLNALALAEQQTSLAFASKLEVAELRGVVSQAKEVEVWTEQE